MQPRHVVAGDAAPAPRPHVVHGDAAPRVGVAPGRLEDGAPGQLQGFVGRHVGPPPAVQHAVRVARTRAHRKRLARDARAFAVHVVKAWPSFVPAADHGAHAEPHALVLIHHVGQQLGGSSHGDGLLVPQLVHPALPGQQPLPEAAVGRPAGHGAQQGGVDLYHLLHRLRGDVGAGRGAGIHRHHHAVGKLKGQRRGAVQELQAGPGQIRAAPRTNRQL